MPDDIYDDQEDDENDDGSGLVRRLRADLKESKRQLKEREQATSENDQLRRQLAFRDAGLDMNNPQVQFLAQHYDGDPSVDAVKAKATELGLVQVEEPAAAAQLAEMQKAGQLAAGADAPGSFESREAEYHDALNNARSQDEVLAVMRKFDSPSAPPPLV